MKYRGILPCWLITPPFSVIAKKYFSAITIQENGNLKRFMC
jgi:hypothetical protein